MAILASEALTWIETSIGGSTQDPGVQILNAAGEMLTQMHEWRWLEREDQIGVVSGTDYALLPSDFRALVSVHESASYSGVSITTLSHLNALKAAGYSGQTFFTCAVTYNTTISASIPTPVLRLDPTPSANDATLFNIAYLAGWTELASDDSAVVIPAWIKPLYRQLVIAYARGYDEDDETRAAPAGQLIEEHLAVIRRGETFSNAVRRDAQINPSDGRIRKGWLQTGNQQYGGHGGAGYLRTVPAGPSSL